MPSTVLLNVVAIFLRPRFTSTRKVRQTGDVQRRIDVETSADPTRLFAVVADLSTYSQWMGLIEKCELAKSAPGDAGPAWWVTLRAKVGPFARSKRLRMVRTVHDAPRTVRFERCETDGRSHSAWTMDAVVSDLNGSGTPQSFSSAVTVQLTYSGGLWSGPLDAVLGSQVEDAVPRLRQFLTA